MFVSVEATKNILLFWVMPPNILGVSVVGFFTFDLFDLLILIPGVHCCIVLVVSLKNIRKASASVKHTQTIGRLLCCR